jgi:hypothetical protein
VLEDVEAGAFEEHPARKHPAVLRSPALADVDLDEGAGLLREFPRRSPLAGGDADDHRSDLARIARLELDFFRDVVALVEQAKHGDALVHRSRSAGIRGGRGSGRTRLCRRGFTDRDLYRFAPAWCGEFAGRERQWQSEDQTPHRTAQLSALPGVQAS